jgi:hypothetical protein
MSNEVAAFFDVLFGANFKTCFADSVMGTTLGTSPKPGDVFFSINSMDGSRRLDSAVNCYRNILLEFDSMPLDEQIEYVTSKLPVTSIVYSGNKSYHFIISLEEPLASVDDYKSVFNRIKLLVPGLDSSTSNPSRFSRIPNVVRPDTQTFQDLVKLGSRVNNSKLFAMLPVIKAPVREVVNKNSLVAVRLMEFVQNPDEAMQVLGVSGRNAFFFWLGKRIDELRLDGSKRHSLILTAYERLKNKSNFSWNEAKLAARLK